MPYSVIAHRQVLRKREVMRARTLALCDMDDDRGYHVASYARLRRRARARLAWVQIRSKPGVRAHESVSISPCDCYGEGEHTSLPFGRSRASASERTRSACVHTQLASRPRCQLTSCALCARPPASCSPGAQMVKADKPEHTAPLRELSALEETYRACIYLAHRAGEHGLKLRWWHVPRIGLRAQA